MTLRNTVSFFLYYLRGAKDDLSGIRSTTYVYLSPKSISFSFPSSVTTPSSKNKFKFLYSINNHTALESKKTVFILNLMIILFEIWFVYCTIFSGSFCLHKRIGLNKSDINVCILCRSWLSLSNWSGRIESLTNWEHIENGYWQFKVVLHKWELNESFAIICRDWIITDIAMFKEKIPSAFRHQRS